MLLTPASAALTLINGQESSKIVTSEGEGASASSISFGGNFDLMPKAAKRYGGSAPKDMAGT